MTRYNAAKTARVAHYTKHDTTKAKGAIPTIPFGKAFSIGDFIKECQTKIGGADSIADGQQASKKQKTETATGAVSANNISGDVEWKEDVIRLLFALHVTGAVTINNL